MDGESVVGFPGTFEKLRSWKNFKPFVFSDERKVFFDGAHYVKNIPCGLSTISWRQNRKTLYVRLDFWTQKSAKLEIFSGQNKVYSSFYYSKSAGEAKLGLGSDYLNETLKIYAECPQGRDFALLTNIEIVTLPNINSKYLYIPFILAIVLLYFLINLFKINITFGANDHT